MRVKDEWRDVLADQLHDCGFGPTTDKDLDFILSRVAPLIAEEVIEACALSVQANGGRRQAIAEEIRREVPKRLGIGG